MNQPAKWIIGVMLLCIVIVTLWCRVLSERINSLKDEMLRTDRRQMETQGISESYAVFVSLRTIATQDTAERREGMFNAEMHSAASRVCQVLMQLPEDSKDLKVLRALYRAGQKPYEAVIEHLEAVEREYGTDRSAKLRKKLSEPSAGGDGKPAPQP